MGNETVNRVFQVGPKVTACLHGLVWVEPEFCAECAKLPKGPAYKVTAVDRENGVITVDSDV